MFLDYQYHCVTHAREQNHKLRITKSYEMNAWNVRRHID